MLQKIMNAIRPLSVPTKSFFFFPNAGISVSPTHAMKISALNRGVVYLSTQMAKLPIQVKNKKLEVLEDRSSFLLNTAPNDEMTAFEFWTSIISDALLEGNGYAEIERNAYGAVTALYLLDTNTVFPFRDERGRLKFRVTGETKDVILSPRDILKIPNMHIKNGFGMGIVEWGQTTLGIQVGADEMASSIFQNGGFPSGVISTPKKLSEEAQKRLKDSWKAAYGRGGNQRGGTAVIEEGATYTPIDVKPDTLQFLESRKFGVVEIARFLNVPPHKLYDQTGSTYDNVEQANLEVRTDTLDSWAVAIENEIEVKILNNGYADKTCSFDFFPLVRGDMKTRSDYFKAMMLTAALSPNEIRQLEGRAPYEGGDEYYIQSNNYTPVSRMTEVIDAQIAKNNTPAPSERDIEAEEEERELTRALAKKLDRG